MKTKSAILMSSVLVLFASGCAELTDPGESGIGGAHPPDWSTPGSADSHAAVMADEGLPNSAEGCASCHGEEYGKPDPDADPPVPASDCFECHAEGEDYGHPDTGFDHGQEVIDIAGTDECGNCHSWESGGELDFDLGGWSQQACDTCHAGGRSGHPGMTEWFNPTSPNFHGTAAAGALIKDCAQCHGDDYLGDWTESSCNTCHPAVDIHPGDWVGSNETEGSHGYYVTTGGFDGWPDVADCRGCHGEDLEGGWAGEDCRGCHSDQYPPGP